MLTRREFMKLLGFSVVVVATVGRWGKLAAEKVLSYVTVSARVIRADGTIEDLGVVGGGALIDAHVCDYVVDQRQDEEYRSVDLTERLARDGLTEVCELEIPIPDENREWYLGSRLLPRHPDDLLHSMKLPGAVHVKDGDSFEFSYTLGLVDG